MQPCSKLLVACLRCGRSTAFSYLANPLGPDDGPMVCWSGGPVAGPQVFRFTSQRTASVTDKPCRRPEGGMLTNLSATPGRASPPRNSEPFHTDVGLRRRIFPHRALQERTALSKSDQSGKRQAQQRCSCATIGDSRNDSRSI